MSVTFSSALTIVKGNHTGDIAGWCVSSIQWYGYGTYLSSIILFKDGTCVNEWLRLASVHLGIRFLVLGSCSDDRSFFCNCLWYQQGTRSRIHHSLLANGNGSDGSRWRRSFDRWTKVNNGIRHIHATTPSFASSQLLYCQSLFALGLRSGIGRM